MLEPWLKQGLAWVLRHSAGGVHHGPTSRDVASNARQFASRVASWSFIPKYRACACRELWVSPKSVVS